MAIGAIEKSGKLCSNFFLTSSCCFVDYRSSCSLRRVGNCVYILVGVQFSMRRRSARLTGISVEREL